MGPLPALCPQCSANVLGRSKALRFQCHPQRPLRPAAVLGLGIFSSSDVCPVSCYLFSTPFLHLFPCVIESPDTGHCTAHRALFPGWPAPARFAAQFPPGMQGKMEPKELCPGRPGRLLEGHGHICSCQPRCYPRQGFRSPGQEFAAGVCRQQPRGMPRGSSGAETVPGWSCLAQTQAGSWGLCQLCPAGWRAASICGQATGHQVTPAAPGELWVGGCCPLQMDGSSAHGPRSKTAL